MTRKLAKAGKDYLRLGRDMLAAGDTETAVKALRVAVADLPRSVEARVALAAALRQAGDIGDAVVVLSEALALPPVSEEAAHALSALLQRFRLDEPDDIDPAGLRAALTCVAVDRQPLVRAAFDWLKKAGALREPIALGRAQGWEAAAVGVLERRGGGVLRDGLLRDALAAGFNSDPEIEQLLTAMRRHILLAVADGELLANKDLFTFSLALAAQVDINEGVWVADAAEQAAMRGLATDFDALAAGSAEAAAGLVKRLLYTPVRQTALSDWPGEAVGRLRPKALAALLGPIVAAGQVERELAAGIEGFNVIADATSARVAGQYEKSPYPRWTSLNRAAPAIRLDEIERVFGAETARPFRDGGFDVLVAGCGTGQHAAQVAVAYGAGARVLGVDLSRASLAYAQRMAAEYGLGTVSFAQADLLDARAIGRQFDIVECIGVLHHMADPFQGWRSVLEVLKPGGLMFVGLYSAVARRGLAALRAAPGYPGAGCDDDAARAYRARLFAVPGEAGASALSASQNFYTLSNFRDLVLHECEHRMTLDEIAAFLRDEGLAFGGFAVDEGTAAQFRRGFPDEKLPGRLESWAQFERDNPKTFEGMYNFWCRRA